MYSQNVALSLVNNSSGSVEKCVKTISTVSSYRVFPAIG